MSIFILSAQAYGLLYVIDKLMLELFLHVFYVSTTEPHAISQILPWFIFNLMWRFYYLIQMTELNVVIMVQNPRWKVNKLVYKPS